MKKLKTRHSANKRFKRTKGGSFIRKKAFKGHLLEKKSSSRKGRLSRLVQVSIRDKINVQSMLPYA